MLLVQLGINSTRDVWKFAKLDSPRRLVQFWQDFQTSLVLLIPNCTRHRMITYTNFTTTFFIVQRHGSMTTNDYVTQKDQFLLTSLPFNKRPVLP
jgi:hypothetical protein